MWPCRNYMRGLSVTANPASALTALPDKVTWATASSNIQGNRTRALNPG